MAQISITIPNASVSRVVDGVCGFFNYQAILISPIGEQTPNPETKNQFAQRMVVVAVKSWVKSFESQQAAEAARAAANTSADLIDIT